MKVLVGGEYSGIVRNAFTAAGHDATSCDLIETMSPGNHIVGDMFDAFYTIMPDLFICHPSCRYLSKAGLHLCIGNPVRSSLRDDAVLFVRRLYGLPCKKIAIENPTGYLSSAWRPYDQLIQPHWFGDPYRKEICLWLKGLPPLISTCLSPDRYSVNRHTNGRMKQEERSRVRSKFFPGVAAAMAKQWT